MPTKQIKMTEPFLKWAGGKSQLITQIESHFSEKILNTKKIYLSLKAV